ncbi:MAG: hypothetical protein EXX96DRAFT_609211 [Benjaminiella poitrasii]|nr:MAG: hypothetical protein EXX96DRAFT_609211 [Benjaminiella poitrasii]
MTISTQFCKIKSILFPPTKFPTSKVSAYDKSDQRNYTTDKNAFREYNKTPITCTKSKEMTLPLVLEEEENDYRVEFPPIFPNTRQDEKLLSMKDFSSVNSSAACIHQIPIYDHPNKHDKQVLSSAVKRWLLPHKTMYELEWTIPNPSLPKQNNKVWLQLDEQTSSGIERVRRLGFADLDVRLDDSLTNYIKSTFGDATKPDNILIQVLFDNQIKREGIANTRKDSLLDDESRNSHFQKGEDKEICLLRLRRVHWWTKSYNMARTCLPCTN